MPVYYDFTNTHRHSWLHSWHRQIACEYLGVLRKRSYGDRDYSIDADELALDDLSDDVIITWAAIRHVLGPKIVHLWRCHRHESFTDHDGEGKAHGHISPLLAWLAPNLPETVDSNEIERAERDLHGLIGMRMAYSRSKISPPPL